MQDADGRAVDVALGSVAFGRPSAPASPVVELARYSAWTVTAALLLGAFTVWLRFLAGALERPLGWPGFALTAVGVAAAATVARLARKAEDSCSHFRPENAKHGRRLTTVPPPFRPAGDVMQQLIRSRLPNGSECVGGWVRVPLAAGQRSASLHVAFCPPLIGIPRVRVEQHEGPAARIREAQVLPYGVRLDLKLVETPERPESVLVEIAVRTDPPAAEEA